QTIKVEKTQKQLELEGLYKQVREYREGKTQTISRSKVFEHVSENFPNDWLLSVELFELAYQDNQSELCDRIAAHLETVKQNRPQVGHLIDDGLKIIKQQGVLN